MAPENANNDQQLAKSVFSESNSMPLCMCYRLAVGISHVCVCLCMRVSRWTAVEGGQEDWERGGGGGGFNAISGFGTDSVLQGCDTVCRAE